LAGRVRGGGKYLVCGKSAPFAGRRKSADLGRLVTCAAVPPRRAGSPATKGALRYAEEGNDVGPRPKMRGQPMRGRRNALAPGDASFARSEGPCTSIVAQRSGGKPSGGHALSSASRSGKPTQVGGTGTEVEENGRSAARRVSPFLARGTARYVRKGRRLRPSSLRGVESRGRSARTS
jgi:hypothetical protein